MLSPGVWRILAWALVLVRPISCMRQVPQCILPSICMPYNVHTQHVHATGSQVCTSPGCLRVSRRLGGHTRGDDVRVVLLPVQMRMMPWLLQACWPSQAAAMLTAVDGHAGVAAAANRMTKDPVCFSSSGELLLHGPLLWDWRSPRAVHSFDVFSDTPGSGSFHPYGLELILNSEVAGCPLPHAVCVVADRDVLRCIGLWPACMGTLAPGGRPCSC